MKKLLHFRCKCRSEIGTVMWHDLMLSACPDMMDLDLGDHEKDLKYM